MGFEEFSGEVGGETTAKEEQRVADDDEKSDDEESIGGEKGEIEKFAERRSKENKGDDAENNGKK